MWIRHFIKVGLGLEEEKKEEVKYQPITKVYAYPKGSMDSGPIFMKHFRHPPVKSQSAILHFIKVGLGIK